MKTYGVKSIDGEEFVNNFPANDGNFSRKMFEPLLQMHVSNDKWHMLYKYLYVNMILAFFVHLVNKENCTASSYRIHQFSNGIIQILFIYTNKVTQLVIILPLVCLSYRHVSWYPYAEAFKKRNHLSSNTKIYQKNQEQ